MPPSDQEPRYQLVDSNGNVVGSLFGDGSGNVVIADETDTQTTFGPNGITTPALEANTATINKSTLISDSFVLNDDEATDTGFDKSDTVFIFLHGERDGEIGAYGVSFSILYTLSEGDGFDSSSTGQVLSGTTGTDGVINISVANGDLYLENRSGEQQTIRLFGFDLRD